MADFTTQMNVKDITMTNRTLQPKGAMTGSISDGTGMNDMFVTTMVQPCSAISPQPRSIEPRKRRYHFVQAGMNYVFDEKSIY